MVNLWLDFELKKQMGVERLLNLLLDCGKTAEHFEGKKRLMAKKTLLNLLLNFDPKK